MFQSTTKKLSTVSPEIDSKTGVTNIPIKMQPGLEKLDNLLLKAESFSHFILEHQKQAKAQQEAILATRKKEEQKKKELADKVVARASSKEVASPIKSDSAKKPRRQSPTTSPAGKRKKARRSDDDIAMHVIDEDNKEEEQQQCSSSNDVVSALLQFQQPANLSGGRLMQYQLEGLQWLISLWENGISGILADEMGLGKTIQVIALIAHLRSKNTAGPFLIAGPLATVSNWFNEFRKWLPDCPVLIYHGSKEEREKLRKTQMPVSTQKSLSFPIILTSFEICIIDRPHLERFNWQYVILDEGHRIKNRNCRLIRELKQLPSVSRLLLTGTPIQNSLEELWSLLNFCSPVIFADLQVFQSWFGFRNIGKDTKVEDIIDTEQRARIVTKLHEILRPFVLRRLKRDVLDASVYPPKRDVVIYCGMSLLQQEFYKLAMDGSLRDNLISMQVENAKGLSQINLLMNLRKICNHPFLLGDLKDKQGMSIREHNVKLLTMASGKFKLLDRMLPRLRREGHKVLIFSQMTKLLDILEDFLIAKSYTLVRFDGSTKREDRQRYIDRFNDNSQDTFIFLLSTRAGGLGINLTAADTVILFDSDWNPHQDSQAQDRCHRIGQKRAVVTYRLLTSGSVEIDMMKKQISKKKLERLTIHGGDYRQAGRRQSKAVTVDDLRLLLEDDVKNLARMESCLVDEGQEGQQAQGGTSWLQKDISEEELDAVMNRDLLFDVNSALYTAFMNNKSSSDPPIEEEEGTMVETEKEEPLGQEGQEPSLAVKVRVEGEMYDIITTSADEIFSSIR